jgi:hypothetical protein
LKSWIQFNFIRHVYILLCIYLCIGLHHMDYVFQALMHTLVKNHKHVDTYIINWHLNFIGRCLALLAFSTLSLPLIFKCPIKPSSTCKVFSPCLLIIDQGVSQKWSIKQEKKRGWQYICILGYNGPCRFPIPDLNGNWSIYYTSLTQMRILKIKDTFFLMHSLGTSLFYWQNFAKRSHSHCLWPWWKETLTPTWSVWAYFGGIAWFYLCYLWGGMVIGNAMNQKGTWGTGSNEDFRRPWKGCNFPRWLSFCLGPWFRETLN